MFWWMLSPCSWRIYREHFYSALHSHKCTTGCEMNTNFANESVHQTTLGMKLLQFTDHRRRWKCGLSTHRHSSHQQKMFCLPFEVVQRNICNLPTNNVFSFCSSFQRLLLYTVSLKQPQKKKIIIIKIKWTCCENISKNSCIVACIRLFKFRMYKIM
jgi:hypothetical protein